MPSKNSITVYSRPGCQPCLATARAFGKAEITYATVDVSKDLNAAEALRSAGHLMLPVVMIQDAGHVVRQTWAGFRPDLISELAASIAAARPVAVPA